MARPSPKRYSKRPADVKSEEIKRKVIESQTKKRNETARRQEVSQVKDTQEIVAREDEQRVIRKDEPVVVSNENEVVSKDIIFQQDVPRDELGVQEESDEYKTREKLEVPDWAEGNVLGDIIRGTASFAC